MKPETQEKISNIVGILTVISYIPLLPAPIIIYKYCQAPWITSYIYITCGIWGFFLIWNAINMGLEMNQCAKLVGRTLAMEAVSNAIRRNLK